MRYDDPQRPRSPTGERLQVSGAPLPVVTLLAPADAGGGEFVPGLWLACIHPARGGNRFGYHSAVLDLREFGEDWLASPERALAKHFGYTGLEEIPSARAPVLTDLWED